MKQRPKLKVSNFLRESLDTVVFVVAVFVLVEMALPRFLVEGKSMQPNFESAQRLVVSRLNYMFGEPQPGDVVIFNAPDLPATDPPLIKRLIGMPGDVVEIRDSKIYVNGTEIHEDYINESCIPNRCRDNRWELAENQYFLMGDNRNNSRDSRVFGPVPRAYIIGEALLRYWPLADITVNFNHSYE